MEWDKKLSDLIKLNFKDQFQMNDLEIHSME